MPRIDFTVRQTPNQVTVVGRVQGYDLQPLIILWCLAGGLAVGLALAVMLAVLGLIEVGADWTPFRGILGGGTLGVGTLLFMLALRLIRRHRELRITFNYAAHYLSILPVGSSRSRPIEVHFLGAVAFEIQSRPGLLRRYCELVLHTHDQGVIALACLRGARPTERSGLPQLAERLNQQLNAVQSLAQTVSPPSALVPPI